MFVFSVSSPILLLIQVVLLSKYVSADTDLQETLAVSKLELLEDLPWWVNFGDGTRRLDYANATTMADEVEATLTSKIESSAKTGIRGTSEVNSTSSAVMSSATVTSGFCLPSTATKDVPFGNCRDKVESCSSNAPCCRGLTCQSGRCRDVCQGAGRQCNNDQACCSKQCVVCTSACQGRCGLGEPKSNDDIQIFYYPWYASTAVDGSWRHWAINAHPEGGAYDPSNNDLPAAFYPRLGPYSSTSLEVLNTHMRWIARAGIGTVVVSWWGKGSFEDELLPKILNVADDWGLKVAFYIESYGGGYVRTSRDGQAVVGTRTPFTAADDVKYLIQRYGCHRAIYRREGRPVFMFFAARSYKDGDQTEWKQVWDRLHADADYNPVVIAHDTNLDGRIIAGGWDGGHDYGTNAAYTKSQDWKTLASAYAAAGKTLYFTVSPGYDKTRLRGNTDAVIERQNGQLYKTFWMRAIAAKKNKNPVVITSFNELHEGTQIEPVKLMSHGPYTYLGNTRDAYTYEDYEGAWGLTGEAAAFSYIDYTRKYSTLYRNA